MRRINAIVASFWIYFTIKQFPLPIANTQMYNNTPYTCTIFNIQYFVKIVKEINGVPCLCPEQEFYHLMHISPPFLSVSFFIPPLQTPARNPFSEIIFSLQLVIVHSVGCARVENFITVLLCRLTTQSHNSEGHAQSIYNTNSISACNRIQLFVFTG